MIDQLFPSRRDAVPRRAAALRRAAVHAAQAPSVLNTQPWRLRIHDGALHIHADHTRQLAALDPQRRVLTTSIGCAVFAARSALAVDGYAALVRRFPEPGRPDLVAIVEPADGPVDRALARLAGRSAAPEAGRPGPYLPRRLSAELGDAAAAEGVGLRLLGGLERDLVAELNRQADAIENFDPTYRAELDAWTYDDAERLRVAGPAECLALLVADGDTPRHWLQAGEALMRVMRTSAAAGHRIAPSTQVVEVPSARAQLRRALGLTGHAHVLLRWASRPPVVPHRRRLVDVLVEES